MAAVDAIKQHVIRGQARGLMAGSASGPIVRNPPPRVSECRARPCRGRVAGGARAGSREAGPGMVRHRPAHRGGALPLSGVATVAIGRRDSGSGVAEVAGHGHMRAGQWKTCGVVIKDGAQPGGRGVARRAGGGVTGSDVVWYRSAEGRGALPGGSVATVAIGGQRAAVVAVHMAQRTGDGRVRTGQGEGCGGVIER